VPAWLNGKAPYIPLSQCFPAINEFCGLDISVRAGIYSGMPVRKRTQCAIC
jgi:hypothetical protein